MPPFGPIKRQELIRALRQAGYLGPYPGGSHEYLVKGAQRLHIPNLHGGEIGPHLLARVLKQAGLTREEWERL